MLRYVHRTGVGVVAWRQASGAAVAATCAPRDNHRRMVSRGRVVRTVQGYGISGIGAAAGTPAPITLTAATGSASATGGGIGNATGSLAGIALGAATGSASATGGSAGNAAATLASITLTAATGIQPGVNVLDADRFDYRRALRITYAYGVDPAIARMGARMSKRYPW